jgi:two-component system OmpR family response regulator
MMRILVVEDNLPIARAVQTMLEAQKFASNVVTDGETGLDHLLRQSYDAAIVDVGLPGMDGFTVARNARAEGVQTPILMLTARDAVEDRVHGLDCGADDYLVKPFVEQELIARLRAILRRGDRPLVDALEVGKLRVDVGARTATYDSRPLELGATEFRLLELFARNAGIALSRAQVLERIWDYDFDGSSNIVDVYVSQLRRKLKKLGASGVIETVWGVGYRLQS